MQVHFAPRASKIAQIPIDGITRKNGAQFQEAIPSLVVALKLDNIAAELLAECADVLWISKVASMPTAGVHLSLKIFGGWKDHFGPVH
jgi:hypothetical protein